MTCTNEPANRYPEVFTLAMIAVFYILFSLWDNYAHAATVTSRSGVSVRVSDRAAGALQCVINGIEATGYRIKFMRGIGRGTVRGSLHPAGMAIDINQIRRGVTTPRMPRSEISIANSCGVISGAQWANNDSGHFQVGGWSGHRHAKHRRSHKQHLVHRHTETEYNN